MVREGCSEAAQYTVGAPYMLIIVVALCIKEGLESFFKGKQIKLHPPLQ